MDIILQQTISRLMRPAYIQRLGAVVTGFMEIDSLTESADTFTIKEVTHNDVTNKHFKDWFFKMDDWQNETPDTFPYEFITSSDEHIVYGYFNGENLDGIIRVDARCDHFYISFFFVNEALQSQGIGQRLFTFVLNNFTDKKLILYVYADNKPALHIYRKYGFKVIGSNKGEGYKPESRHYIMQKDVDDLKLP